MKSPRSKTAYAVVDKTKPVIRTNDIFETRDITTEKNERIIKVVISEVKGRSKGQTW